MSTLLGAVGEVVVDGLYVVDVQGRIRFLNSKRYRSSGTKTSVNCSAARATTRSTISEPMEPHSLQRNAPSFDLE